MPTRPGLLGPAVVESPEGLDPWQLPAIIGAELARANSQAQAALARYQRHKSLSRADLGTLMATADTVRRIAMASQQISRLATGRLRQSHEKLSIDQVLRKLLADNDWRYYQSGLLIEQHLSPVEVIVDPGLLVSLCEAALDCAACYGQVLTLHLKIMNWPEHGLLTVQAHPHVPEPGRSLRDREETLDWILLSRLAMEMGVVVRREIHDDRMSLQLQFARTVKHLEGLTAIEVDGGQSSLGTESRPLAGHRVLLVARDRALRWELEAILRDMKLVLEVVPTCEAAVRFCERGRPDMIIVDAEVRDAHFDELRQDLLRYDQNFPCMEIAAEPNVVEMAAWDGDRMSRLSRDTLRAQLPSILAIELAKVF